MAASDIVRRLGLSPHPEGGHFKETFRHQAPDGGRGAITAIYYLLAAGEVARWHRVDATEIWHWYGGAPLVLEQSADGKALTSQTLGGDLAAGQRPQAVVPVGVWQSAHSLGAWSLIGCTVAPAFQFEGFEMAAPDWRPGAG